MDEQTRVTRREELVAARGEPRAEHRPPPQGITRPGMPSAVADSGLDGVPQYKGAPLDAARGPGLGCFWIQVALLTALVVATPVSVIAGAPTWLSAALLLLTLVLLFFVGQTVIFLLRLVAADRRSRRRPLREGARRTVGQIEDEPDEAPDDEGSAARH